MRLNRHDALHPEEILRLLDPISAAAAERDVLDPEGDDRHGTVRGLALRTLDALRDYYRDEVEGGAYRTHAANEIFAVLRDADPRALAWLATYLLVYFGGVEAERGS